MYAEDESGETSRTRLAKIVRDRRRELGLSVREAAERGGIARNTWSSLEDGTRRTADSNYASIERALQWAAGSVAAILEGGEPAIETAAQESIPLSEQDRADAALRRVMLSDLSDQQKRAIVEMLIEQRKEAERQRVRQAEEMIRLMSGRD